MKFTRRDVAIAIEICHRLVDAGTSRTLPDIATYGELTHICDIITALAARQYRSPLPSIRQSAPHARPKRSRRSPGGP